MGPKRAPQQQPETPTLRQPSWHLARRNNAFEHSLWAAGAGRAPRRKKSCLGVSVCLQSWGQHARKPRTPNALHKKPTSCARSISGESTPKTVLCPVPERTNSFTLSRSNSPPKLAGAVIFCQARVTPGSSKDRFLQLARLREAGIGLVFVAGGLVDLGHDEQRLDVRLHLLQVRRILRQSLQKGEIMNFNVFTPARCICQRR